MAHRIALLPLCLGFLCIAAAPPTVAQPPLPWKHPASSAPAPSYPPSDAEIPFTPASPYGAAPRQLGSPAPTPRRRSAPEPLTRVYRVDDLISAFCQLYQVEEPDARQLVTYEMRRGLIGVGGQFAYNGNHLVVRAEQELHDVFAGRLETLRGVVFSELDVHVCLAEADSELIQQLSLPWNITSLEDQQLPHTPAELNSSTATTTRHQTMKWVVIDSESSRQLEKQLEQSEQFHLIGKPQVRTFNGRRATAESGAQRPYVIGLKDNIPQVRSFPAGWSLQVTAETREGQGDLVFIRGHWDWSRVLGVETVEQPNQRLQIPEIEKLRLNWTHELPLGSTLVLAGNRRKVRSAEGEERLRESLVLMRVTRPAARTARPTPNPTSPAPPMTHWRAPSSSSPIRQVGATQAIEDASSGDARA
ncbi:MAG: hypothetical protein KDB14_14585, partial [Planctomycetales bacterium]|nr:hypothetical protein [Planctomycetales bacterium]